MGAKIETKRGRSHGAKNDTSGNQSDLTRQKKLTAQSRSHLTDGRRHRLTDMLAVNLSTLPKPSQGD
jgi:hypothetical protein